MTTVRKKAVHEVLHSAGHALPGTTFDCPVEDVAFLESVGAIEDPEDGHADASQTAGDPPEDDEGTDPEDGDESVV